MVPIGTRSFYMGLAPGSTPHQSSATAGKHALSCYFVLMTLPTLHVAHTD